MHTRDYYEYILANRKNGVLYTGVTGDLENEHLNTKII